MQSSTVTRSIAHIAFTTTQIAPSFAFSPAEEMLILGISDADFTDRAQDADVQLVEAEREARDVEASNRPTFRQAHPECAGAWLASSKAFRAVCAREKMVMAPRVRIPAMAALLEDPALRSSTHATPEQLDRLAGLIDGGHLLPDWTLAPLKAAPAAPVRSLAEVQDESARRASRNRS